MERESQPARNGAPYVSLCRVFAKTTNIMRLLYNWCIQADMASTRTLVTRRTYFEAALAVPCTRDLNEDAATECCVWTLYHIKAKSSKAIDWKFAYNFPFEFLFFFFSFVRFLPFFFSHTNRHFQQISYFTLTRFEFYFRFSVVREFHKERICIKFIINTIHHHHFYSSSFLLSKCFSFSLPPLF